VNSPAALQLGFDKLPRLSAVIGSLLLVFVAGLGDILAAGRDDPQTIVVGSEVNSEAVEGFEISHGRDPNEAELGELHRVWIENEVLYREGLKRQRGMVDIVDLGRDRLIMNALSALDASIELPPIDDAKLRDWFEKQRARYDQPARYDFEEAVLAGDPSEPAVRAFASTLNSGVSGDAHAGLRVFKDRTHSNVVLSYGPDIARTFQESTTTEWRALRSRDGWRAMRVLSMTPAKPAVYATLRDAVLRDWTLATGSELHEAALRKLVRTYNIVYEPAAHHHGGK
jgi:hypothetical protein